MALNYLFETESSAEREERLKNLEKKLFPFEERAWAQEMLKDNIVSRISENEKMFHYLNIKTIRMEESTAKREKALDKWCKGYLKKTIQDDDLVFFFAMVDMELKSTCFEELPTAEDIRSLAEEYKKSLLPELKERGKRKFLFF